MSYRLRSLRIVLSYFIITTALLFLTIQTVAEPSGDPTLVSYPLSYDFTLTAGDSVVSESLYVYEAEGRAIDFWCYNYASWLHLDTVPAVPLITPKSIWVNIYTAGLAPGFYVDSIFLWSSVATNDPLVVPVYLTVEGSNEYEVRTEPDWMYATMASGVIQTGEQIPVLHLNFPILLRHHFHFDRLAGFLYLPHLGLRTAVGPYRPVCSCANAIAVVVCPFS